MATNASMLPADTSSSEPRIVDAAIRIFEAGQRVILDRVDLARLDLAQAASAAVRGAALIALGAVLLAGAWFSAMGGVVVWLQTYLTLPASLAVVGGLSAVVGAAAVTIGVRRAAAIDLLKPDVTDAAEADE